MMKQYAMILDKGECRSTLVSFFVNGVLANREQWEKYNYYPQDGQVGLLVEAGNGDLEHNIDIGCIRLKTLVLKINDNIYVPMTKKGLRFITEDEYNIKSATNNLNQSRTNKQDRINNQFDSFQAGIKGISYVKGAFYEVFWSDICQILKRHTNDFTIPMYHNDLMKEALIYAFDMCREFQRVSGYIDSKRKLYIASEVCQVFDRNFVEFTEDDADLIMHKVHNVEDFEELSFYIDNHYKLNI